jgi:Tfp pilus tip-associated adhesin PilY1
MPFTVNRTIYTCAGVADCSSLVAFDSSTLSQAALGASSSDDRRRIIDHAKGIDVNDENNNGNVTESRASIHGDVVHSQPLAINYGPSTGVVLFYGGNDGLFRAVSGDTGQELWAFVAPEHHSKLKRLADNSPSIQYPQMGAGITPAPQRKDYFFDGTAGLYQSIDSTQVWVYPTMRRGGRMVYAFDVTNPSAPTLKWRVGCPNLTDDVGCTTGYTAIGQTWSTPRVARILGYNRGATPIIVMGGGYDPCEDTDVASPTSCNGSGVKGRRILVISASTGELLASFSTQRSVGADVTLVDRNGDGYVDHAYAADTGGNIYRVDFSDPLSLEPRAGTSAWTSSHIAYTRGAGRKFLFAPTVVALKDRAYIAIGSGDRERPLITNYPYIDDIKNRFYVYIDRFVQSQPVDLDGTRMTDFTSATECESTLNTTMTGWYMDLTAGRGEQVVTSALIFGGVVYFSTNRPVPSLPGVCTANLGEARGYAVNLLNASGTIGTQRLCGGTRSSIFLGGGLAPSPVAAFLPVNGQPKSVVFGGANRSGAPSSPIGAQLIKPTVSAKRTRLYWYTHGDK